MVLETNEESIFYFLMSSIYNMKIDYLAIVYSLLKYADRRSLQMLQFYFIKNELLHFLIENEHEIQLKDKKNIKLLYNTIAYLLKGIYILIKVITCRMQLWMKLWLFPLTKKQNKSNSFKT